MPGLYLIQYLFILETDDTRISSKHCTIVRLNLQHDSGNFLAQYVDLFTFSCVNEKIRIFCLMATDINAIRTANILNQTL